MVELAAWQGQYGYLQTSHLVVVQGGVRAQATAESAVEVILRELPVVCGVTDQHVDGLVRQEPHTDVCQVEVVLLQTVERVDRRLLQHALERSRLLPRTDKDTMVLGYLGTQPQPVAHHVGLGDGVQGLGGADVHVTAHDHRAKALGRMVHDALVERQLQLEQVLLKPLAALPTKHGDGRQNLARRGVGRQPAALSASMEE